MSSDDHSAGGQGEIARSLAEGHHRRSDLRMIDRGIREGWITTFPIDKRFVTLPKQVHDAIDAAATAKDVRSVFIGAGVIVRMVDTNLNIAATVDRVQGNSEEPTRTGSPLDMLGSDPVLVAALSDAAARRGLLGLEAVPVDPATAVSLAVNGAAVGGNGNGHANGSNGNGKH